MATEILGKKLLGLVVNGDLPAIEACMNEGDPPTIKEAVKCPFGILSLLEYTLKDVPIAAKLLCYEINTISAFHLAALMGQNEVIVTILDKISTLKKQGRIKASDKDIPVDMPLDSQSTALHLAAFAGHLETVKMLLDIYQAKVNAQDMYGWSALHYASTEGHLVVVQTLIKDYGADVMLRDKDGTTAAWRAKVNKHEEVVDYLCKVGDEEELLNIEEDEDVPDSDPREALYAKVNKKKKQLSTKSKSMKEFPASSIPEEDPYMTDLMSDYAWVDPNMNKLVQEPKQPPPLIKQSSSPALPSKQLQRSQSAKGFEEPPYAQAVPRSQTLPHNVKKMDRSTRQSTIRRLIRNQLDAVFSDYEQPVQGMGDPGAGGAGAAGEGDAYASFGMNTLRGIMKEEFEKYRKEMEGSQMGDVGAGAAAGEFSPSYHRSRSGDYEDLYETLGDMPPAPPTPQAAPPLPPRNTDSAQKDQKSPTTKRVSGQLDFFPGNSEVNTPKASINKAEDLNQPKAAAVQAPPKFVSGLIQLEAQPTSMALQESIYKLGRIIGSDWKKLAKALPLDKTASKTDARIKAIEKQHPGKIEEQAKAALGEWRLNAGNAADVDAIILALRKCNLHKMIEEVEKVTAEFTA